MHTCSIRNGNRVERFIASGKGRAARVLFGSGLIAVWLLAMPLPAGFALAAFGIVPIGTGALNLCPVAPAWNGHFFGSRYGDDPGERRP